MEERERRPVALFLVVEKGGRLIADPVGKGIAG